MAFIALDGVWLAEGAAEPDAPDADAGLLVAEEPPVEAPPVEPAGVVVPAATEDAPGDVAEGAPVAEPTLADGVAVKQAELELPWMMKGADWAVLPVLSRTARLNCWPAGSLTVHWKGELWTLGAISSTRVRDGSKRRMSKGPTPPVQVIWYAAHWIAPVAPTGVLTWKLWAATEAARRARAKTDFMAKEDDVQKSL
jgi:hypothetical protein